MRKIAKVVIGLFLVVMIGGVLVWEYYDGYTVITPETLPNAKVGQQYDVNMTIYGMHPIPLKNIGPMAKPNITTSFGQNTQLFVHYDEQQNRIVIKGKPEHKGKYSFRIQTGFYAGTSLWLDKTFDLIVE